LFSSSVGNEILFVVRVGTKKSFEVALMVIKEEQYLRGGRRASTAPLLFLHAKGAEEEGEHVAFSSMTLAVGLPRPCPAFHIEAQEMGLMPMLRGLQGSGELFGMSGDDAIIGVGGS